MPVHSWTPFYSRVLKVSHGLHGFGSGCSCSFFQLWLRRALGLSAGPIGALCALYAAASTFGVPIICANFDAAGENRPKFWVSAVVADAFVHAGYPLLPLFLGKGSALTKSVLHFGFLIMFIMIGEVLHGATYSLLDTITLLALPDKALYGPTRLWAGLLFAISSFALGFVVELPNFDLDAIFWCFTISFLLLALVWTLCPVPFVASATIGGEEEAAEEGHCSATGLDNSPNIRCPPAGSSELPNFPTSASPHLGSADPNSPNMSDDIALPAQPSPPSSSHSRCSTNPPHQSAPSTLGNNSPSSPNNNSNNTTNSNTTNNSNHNNNNNSIPRTPSSSSTSTSGTQRLREFARLLDCRLVELLFVVYCMGIASACMNTFVFLLVDDLGGSTAIMGTSILLNICTEVPIFQYSGKIIKLVGARGIIYIGVVAHVLRLVGYALAPTPGAVLLVEPLHGVTFALIWSNLASIGAEISPEGLEATTQGVINGVFNGLGGVTGMLVGGLLYAQSPRLLFWSAAAMMASTLPLMVITDVCLGPSRRSPPSQRVPLRSHADRSADAREL